MSPSYSDYFWVIIVTGGKKKIVSGTTKVPHRGDAQGAGSYRHRSVKARGCEDGRSGDNASQLLVRRARSLVLSASEQCFVYFFMSRETIILRCSTGMKFCTMYLKTSEHNTQCISSTAAQQP